MLTIPPIVVGTLSAPDYALFVSHNHPGGQVCGMIQGHLRRYILKLAQPGTFRRFHSPPERPAMGQIHDVGRHIFTDSQRLRSSGGVHGLLCGEGFGDVRQSMPVAFIATCSASVQTRCVRTHDVLTLPRFTFISQGFFCVGWMVFLRDNTIRYPSPLLHQNKHTKLHEWVVSDALIGADHPACIVTLHG